MIQRSFLFLDKISTRKEQSIWNQRINNWNNFLRTDNIKGISKEKKLFYNRKINEAKEALREEDVCYFVGKLPQKEMWRLFDDFRDSCCYLDIEVDSYGSITVVGISDFYNTWQFVKGANLNGKDIQKLLDRFKIVITFNGGAFDLPKLKTMLKLNLDKVHIDLKPLCVNLSWLGGLKEIEKQLNLRRPSHLYGNPVELWKAFHASGDGEYLDLLLEYNREDIENLKMVMEKVYKIKSSELLSKPNSTRPQTKLPR